MNTKYAIDVLEAELKSLKQQRDNFIFQRSYSLRYTGHEIIELGSAIRELKKHEQS